MQYMAMSHRKRIDPGHGVLGLHSMQVFVLRVRVHTARRVSVSQCHTVSGCVHTDAVESRVDIEYGSMRNFKKAIAHEKVPFRRFTLLYVIQYEQCTVVSMHPQELRIMCMPALL